MEDEHLPDGIKNISDLSILVVTFTVNSPQGPHQPPVQWYLHWNIEPTQMRKWPHSLLKHLLCSIPLCITNRSKRTGFRGRDNAVALALSHGNRNNECSICHDVDGGGSGTISCNISLSNNCSVLYWNQACQNWEESHLCLEDDCQKHLQFYFGVINLQNGTKECLNNPFHSPPPTTQSNRVNSGTAWLVITKMSLLFLKVLLI